MGPTGPSPYDVVRGWHKPFAAPGFAFGGNSGVFAESPDRILVAQRGEFRLPTPVPPEFAGFAGSLKMNVLTLADRRVWQNCLYTLDANGQVTFLVPGIPPNITIYLVSATVGSLTSTVKITAPFSYTTM